MVSILICNQSTILALFDREKRHILCLLFNMFEKCVALCSHDSVCQLVWIYSKINFHHSFIVFFRLAFKNVTKRYHMRKYTRLISTQDQYLWLWLWGSQGYIRSWCRAHSPDLVSQDCSATSVLIVGALYLTVSHLVSALWGLPCAILSMPYKSWEVTGVGT